MYRLSAEIKKVGLGGGFTQLYGPNDQCGRDMMWQELSTVSTHWSFPWCVEGFQRAEDSI